MLQLKIDPTPSLAADVSAIAASTAPNLLDLLQLRRNRELGTRTMTYGATLSPPRRHLALTSSKTGEYRDDDLISVLHLGDAFLVFVTDDGPSPYLFRIIVEGDRIGSVLAGGHAGSGELAVARFAANGIMSWIPLPRAIRSTILETATQLGATILGPVERMELPSGAKTLRLVLRAGSLMSRQLSGLLSLDLCPAQVNEQQLWHGRRYSWNESNPSSPVQSNAAAVNDNETASAPLLGDGGCFHRI